MLKQQFQLKLLQKLSPQQIQLMKLIQLPTQAFEQRIKQEIEENPALNSEKEAEEKANDEYDDLADASNETEDFDIDAYLSDDEIPSYK
jgi:RNA polymerase sigma-54 factor